MTKLDYEPKRPPKRYSRDEIVIGLILIALMSFALLVTGCILLVD